MNAPPVRIEAKRAAAVPRGLWSAGLFLGALLFVLDLSAWNRGMVLGHAYWGRDFVNMWTAGQMIRGGDLHLLYDVETYRAFQQTLFPGLSPHNYSYPPVSFPIAVLLSFLPYPLALLAWMGGTGWLFLRACRPWWPEVAGPAWLALLTPAALMNLWAGHYGFLLGALFLFAWQALDRRPLVAGLLFGCMLIKPHLALMAALALLVRREWRTIAAGVGIVALILLTTSLLFGGQSWWQLVTEVGPMQSAMIDAGPSMYGWMSTSIATALYRWTHEPALVLGVQALVAMLAGAALMQAVRRGAAIRDLALLSATCTFLALPYAFNYDLTVVALGAVAACCRATSGWERAAAGAAFLAPSLGMALGYAGVPFIPLALAGLAIVQYRQALARMSAPSAWTGQARARADDAPSLFPWSARNG